MHDQLTYGHSTGLIQNKDQFVAYVAGPKAPSKIQSLVLSNQTIHVVGKNALVRHTYDAVNVKSDTGAALKIHVLVLQVWNKVPGGWKLLARQAAPLPMLDSVFRGPGSGSTPECSWTCHRMGSCRLTVRGHGRESRTPGES